MMSVTITESPLRGGESLPLRYSRYAKAILVFMSIASLHAYRFQYLKSEAWQTVRVQALVMAEGKCQICGYESVSNDAHHVWYPENIWDTKAYQLVVLCRPCHTFLHAMRPECKTRSECDGKVEWFTFRDAVLAWRAQQISLAKCDNGEFTIDPVIFFERVRSLKGKIQGAVLAGKPLTKEWLGERFAPLFALLRRATCK